jgi:outer membrane protein insertion porin family
MLIDMPEAPAYNQKIIFHHMKKIILTTLLSGLILCAGLTSATAQGVLESAAESLHNKTVKAIEVKGNKTISLATVLSRIKTRVGQDYLPAVISDDLKRLYNTGYFSDVRVDREDFEGGFRVIIFLEEKPIVEDITFTKTRHLKAKKLMSEMQTKAGKFLDRKALQDDVELIRSRYAQKGLTAVQVDVETSIDEATNKARLHFVIREGERIRVRRIRVEGNTAYKDGRIRKVIKTRPKAWFRSGVLNDEILEEDMERIMSFYEQEGYIDAVADYTVEHLYKNFVAVDIQVNEGRRYYVGNTHVGGNKVITKDEIIKVMEEIKPGAPFSRERLTVDIARIRTLYFDNGYIFANVLESTAIDPDSGRVDVTINVEEGGLAYIERIKIQGNTRTRDIVIRRDLKLYPGDRFDGAKLRRSKERLQNLGYFESINFDIEDTLTPERKNLLVQVKEAKTGTFSFGGGFSTVDRLVGFVEIEQRNFDFTNWPTFTGGGQQLSLRAEAGASRANYRLSFTEPWIFDRPVSAGFDVYATSRERGSSSGYAYDEDRLGGQLRLGKQIGEYWAGRTYYKYEEVEIGNFEDNVSAALLAEGGKNTVSVIGVDATYDRRNSAINPTKGFLWTSGVDLAGGFLGADKDFYRIQSQGNYYVPFKWDSVLELRLRAGMIDSYDDTATVPIFERFFAGGSRTVRGYEERGVGPVDSVTQDPVGGEALLVGSVEYTVPLVEFVKLAAFYDFGNVWADYEDFGKGGIVSGTGLGLRIKTPIGPVNLDYGIRLDEQPGQKSGEGELHFSVSRGF